METKALMIKKLLKKTIFFRLFTSIIRVRLALVINYFYDLSSFLKSSSLLKQSEQEHFSSELAMLYHAIEKGLSLPNPRKNFGQDKVTELMEKLDQYCSRYENDEVVTLCLNALAAYLDYSVEGGVCESVREYLERKRGFASDSSAVLAVSRKEIIKHSNIDFGAFCQSRYSIRDFSERSVDENLIRRAVEIARKTPSVCNRQTSRVHVLKGEKKERLLELQMGSRGFSECINTVLVISSDRRAFTKIGERNQCWIDSGMFAMSLIYALHSLGLGSCSLNWSMTHDRDRAARKVFDINEVEAITMLIAVGHIPETLHVASSSRFPVSKFLIEHK